MAEHSELVTEMPLLEKMSVQERLKHARKRRTQQLKRYAQYEKDENKKIKKMQSTKRSPGEGRKRRIAFALNIQLLEAAARGDLEEVRKLLENGVDPNIGNEDGLTALHQCCIDNNEAMMKVLVEHGADVNVTDRELWTPLHAASTCGHVNLAQYLISKGAALLAINSDGNMPYDICEDEVTLDYIESQMATQGITQEQIDELRETAPNQMLADMKKVYDEGVDLEFKDEVGATPLHIAAANGYDKVALFLLEHHADVHARDKDGWQPIHAAACWAHGDMIQLLVQHGADLDSKTDNAETPLTICEDDDLKGLMEQLKVEKMRRPANPLVRRSSSRSKRGSSIRRSSKREKGEMRKKDAQGEAALFFKQSSLTDDENGTDVPSTEIDDVNVNTSEPSSPTALAPSIELTDADATEDGEIPVPMPSIAEYPEGPDSPSMVGEVHQNGIEDLVEGKHGPRKLKSILKRRDDSDASSIDSAGKKGRKSKRDSKEPELSPEEKQRLKEERDKERQRQKEMKEQERLKQQQDKQKSKAERANRREQKRIEKEEAKRRLKERKATEIRRKDDSKRDSGEDQAEQYYKEKMAGKETLAELKRQRSSHGKHINRTLSDASDNDENTEVAESMISPRKDSMDILNDQSPNHSAMKRTSPNIARKLLLNRPSSGSYYLNEGNKQHAEGEVNGVGDQSSLTTSNTSIGMEDPPKKKFSSVGQDNVLTPHDNSRCCIVM